MLTRLLATICLFVTCSVPAFRADGGTDQQGLPESMPLPLIANGSGELDLRDYAGSYLYVDFWASWCGPCRLSLPALDRLVSQFADRQFQAVAISVDVVAEDALDFLSRYPVRYPVAIDTEGDFAKAFGVQGMPSAFLINPDGTVHSQHVGFKKADEALLEALLDSLLPPATP
jgi:thiol-disulfide isomerase/thioredoxin